MDNLENTVEIKSWKGISVVRNIVLNGTEQYFSLKDYQLCWKSTKTTPRILASSTNDEARGTIFDPNIFQDIIHQHSSHLARYLAYSVQVQKHGNAINFSLDITNLSKIDDPCILEDTLTHCRYVIDAHIKPDQYRNNLSSNIHRPLIDPKDLLSQYLLFLKHLSSMGYFNRDDL